MAGGALASLPPEGLRKDEGRSQMDAEDLVPISQREIQRRDDYLVARRVDQDVEIPKRLARPLNRGGGLPGIGEIKGAANRNHPQRLCFGANRLDLIGRSSDDRDVCPSTGKCERERSAYAPPCSGDQGVPSFEVLHEQQV